MSGHWEHIPLRLIRDSSSNCPLSSSAPLTLSPIIFAVVQALHSRLHDNDSFGNELPLGDPWQQAALLLRNHSWSQIFSSPTAGSVSLWQNMWPLEGLRQETLNSHRAELGPGSTKPSYRNAQKLQDHSISSPFIGRIELLPPQESPHSHLTPYQCFGLRPGP